MQTNGYDRQAALMHDDVGGATGLAYGLTPEAQKGSAVPSAPKRRLVFFCTQELLPFRCGGLFVSSIVNASRQAGWLVAKLILPNADAWTPLF